MNNTFYEMSKMMGCSGCSNNTTVESKFSCTTCGMMLCGECGDRCKTHKIDTARILVDWECNLSCTYCCNEQQRFRKDISPVHVDYIDFSKYKFFAISGGEPLLFMNRIDYLMTKIVPVKGFSILYSNGILMTRPKADILHMMGIDAINIGLHYEKSFRHIIKNVSECTSRTRMSVRFHLWDKFKSLNLENEFPDVVFKYWAMDDCDRDNEDRFVLSSDSFPG